MAAHRSAFAEPESTGLTSRVQGQHENAAPSLTAASADELLTSNTPSDLRDQGISSQAAASGSAGSQGMRQGDAAAADSAPGEHLVLAHPSEAGQQTGLADVGPPCLRANPSSSRNIDEARSASGQWQRTLTLDGDRGHVAEVSFWHHHYSQKVTVTCSQAVTLPTHLMSSLGVALVLVEKGGLAKWWPCYPALVAQLGKAQHQLIAHNILPLVLEVVIWPSCNFSP